MSGVMGKFRFVWGRRYIRPILISCRAAVRQRHLGSIIKDIVAFLYLKIEVSGISAHPSDCGRNPSARCVERGEYQRTHRTVNSTTTEVLPWLPRHPRYSEVISLGDLTAGRSSEQPKRVGRLLGQCPISALMYR